MQKSKKKPNNIPLLCPLPHFKVHVVSRWYLHDEVVQMLPMSLPHVVMSWSVSGALPAAQVIPR